MRIGDVTGHGAFTHVSMYQADVVVRDILGDNPYDASYIAVPRVTFTDPEVGAVGLTEAQAREAGLDVRVSSVDLATSARGWIARATGVVKLVADGDVLVGGTVVGPSGGEVMSALAVAVAARFRWRTSSARSGRTPRSIARSGMPSVTSDRDPDDEPVLPRNARRTTSRSCGETSDERPRAGVTAARRRPRRPRPLPRERPPHHGD